MFGCLGSRPASPRLLLCGFLLTQQPWACVAELKSNVCAATRARVRRPVAGNIAGRALCQGLELDQAEQIPGQVEARQCLEIQQSCRGTICARGTSV